MIADLKPYPEYKESGLPWLGRVPGHWDVRKPRHIGSLLKGVGGTKEDALSAGVPCVRYGEIYTTHTFFVRKPKAFIHPDRASNYTPLHYGDVLFAASGETLEEIGKSAVNLIKGTAVCGGDVIILRPTVPVHAPFLGYVMDCRPSVNQKATMGRGTTVKHIYPDELKHLLFPLPPVPEQAAIVRFLNWATGRLERAVRAKRKVIALLNEQKQAIIHRAVTRGLDPSVPLKPSGIPWLGEIPRHWEVIPARHLFRSVTRRDIQGDEPKMSVTQKHGLVPTAEMQENSTQASSFDRFQLCHPSDLVLNKYKAHLGVFWAATRRGLITPNYTVFRPTRRLSTEFFEHLFHTRAYRDTFSMVVYGVIEGMCPLYTEDFYRIPCLCPPHEEQVRIVGALVNMTKTEDTTISRLEREIELLREYRTRLVADVVTGKLDVRAMAAGLPEEGGGEGLGESDVSDMSDVSDSSDESLDAPLPEEEP